MSKELDIQQLVSYLTQNCSKGEELMVEQWINSSEDNKVLFDEFKLVWENSAIKNDSCLIDVDKSWNEFKVLADFKKEEIEVIKPTVGISSRNIFISVSSIAAVIVVLFGLYFLLDTNLAVENINYTATNFQSDSPLLLSDGSSIVMNTGAKIVYPEQFTSDIRNINFKGEAFFEITSNPEKPMIIATDNIRVKVLGTSFSLCNCDNSDEISVYLETGKVLFYSIDNTDGSILEQVVLVPGQTASFSKTTGLITKQEFTNNNHNAWKTGALEFVKAPLSDVIKVLEKTYKIKIDSDESLNNFLLTARFNGETPESIFESLHIIYGFNYEMQGDTVRIY